ncbi:quinone oxidoreductase family protein [Leifsonia sp. Root112D2]|uniref:quinone oxidoreductase family protein n=1 Tax=Leifsonia sp. Root112D2 TaxID=1736426 RepID=UPI0007001203|nr:zinc-binding alcohol dehydrogenase family protein [Leifsonia sp. Root112D2]KQV06528.1 quinone oxidoreductase [Leifsonia sp. Root112D2]
MHAAVVTSFSAPPRFAEVAEPIASREGEEVVEVLAAALYPLVRSKANGSHYTSTRDLPLVPGMDAVVRDAQGQLRYAVLDDTVLGTMAERTVIDMDRSVVLPEHVDPIAVAAGMNPVMSSWVALRRRIDPQPARRILVLGATGNAGRMAVQVAKRFGASQVIAAGRNQALLNELSALGADVTTTLDELAVAADVDIVLDYLWGEPTVSALRAMIPQRTARSAPLTWIQIGSVAGQDAAIPSAALRSTQLQFLGSGMGSVAGHVFAEELPAIAQAITDGEFDIRTRVVPLAEVETAWAQSETGSAAERIVFVP